jgi:hypothetical protein
MLVPERRLEAGRELLVAEAAALQVHRVAREAGLHVRRKPEALRHVLDVFLQIELLVFSHRA